MVMEPTVHIRDEGLPGYPTSLCGVGSFFTLWANEKQLATCSRCLILAGRAAREKS
jgi:hypothetical protein